MMNNAIIREVIDINNRCIEDLHDGTISRALSALQVAMHLFKQRAAAAIDPDGHGLDVTELPVQKESSSTNISLRPQQFEPYYNDLSNNQQQQQEISPTGIVRIKFSPEATSTGSCLLSQTSPKPISLCQHQLLLVVAKEEMDTTSPMSVNRLENVRGAVSTEDVHLICATLLYNMGLLCHKYAYICNCNIHHTTANPTNIVRASKIYELLIQFCNQRNVVPLNHPLNEAHHLSPSASMIQTIQMIAYNNYAEICYELGRYIKCKNCIDVLQYHLTLSPNSASTSTDRNYTFRCGSEIMYRELQLNVLIFRLFPTPTLASAA